MEPVCFIKVEPADDFPTNGGGCLETKKYEEHSQSISHQTLVKIEPIDNAVGNTQSNTAAPSINDETFFGQTNCVSSIGTNQCPCSYCTTAADGFEKNHNLAAKPVDTAGNYIKTTESWNSKATSNQGTEQMLLSNLNKAPVSRLIDEDEHECLRTYGKKSTNCEHCNRLFKRELEEVSQLLEKKRKESVLEESVAKQKKKTQTVRNSLGTQRFWRRDDVHVGPKQIFNRHQVSLQADNCIQVIPDNQTDAVGRPFKPAMEQRSQFQDGNIYEVSGQISGQSQQLTNRIHNGQINQVVKQETGKEYQGSGIDNPGRNDTQEAPNQNAGIDQQQVACEKYENDSYQAPNAVLHSNSEQVFGYASEVNEIHDHDKALAEDQCKIFQVTSIGYQNQLFQPGSAQHTHQDDGGSQLHNCRKDGSVVHHGAQEISDHDKMHNCSQHGIEEQSGHQHQFHSNENIDNKHLAFVLEGKNSCKHQDGRKGRITSKCASCDKLFREKLQELENLQLPNTKPLPRAKPSPKPKPQELNRNKCPGCHKQFFEALHQLDLQLRATHRPICCSKCNLLFTTTAAFENHKAVCGEAKQEVNQEGGKGKSVGSSDSITTLSEVRIESKDCQCSESHPKPTEMFTESIGSETNSPVTGTPSDVFHKTSTKDSRAPIYLSKNGRVRVSSLVVSHPELKSLSTDEKRPYQCRICSKCFRNECHLEYHIRTHTGERPHVCDVCRKSFAQPSVLLRHFRRVHTNERPFKCPKCAKSFFTHSEMKKHLERH